VTGAKVTIAKGSALMAAVARCPGTSAVIGIEADHLPVSSRSAIVRQAKGLRLRETSGMIEHLRMVKDEAEIERLQRAVMLGATLLPIAIDTIRPGIPETAVAAELEYGARQAGAEGMSFETIVASGARSALPHGVASSAPVAPNGFVVLDFGVILAGYCSDMTRTVHVGRASRESRRIYETVLEAQLAAVAAVKPGATALQVDRAARRVLTKAGLGKFFTHSTGHGVGLEIHEPPRLGKNGDAVLQPGMVITVEPGAYVPGRGGVRIEDMVLVTERGCEVLTPAPKDWIEI